MGAFRFQKTAYLEFVGEDLTGYVLFQNIYLKTVHD